MITFIYFSLFKSKKVFSQKTIVSLTQLIIKHTGGFVEREREIELCSLSLTPKRIFENCWNIKKCHKFFWRGRGRATRGRERERGSVAL